MKILRNLIFPLWVIHEQLLFVDALNTFLPISSFSRYFSYSRNVAFHYKRKNQADIAGIVPKSLPTFIYLFRRWSLPQSPCTQTAKLSVTTDLVSVSSSRTWIYFFQDSARVVWVQSKCLLLDTVTGFGVLTDKDA